MRFGIGVLGATGYIGEPYRREIRECRDDAALIALGGRRLDRLRAAAELDQATCCTDDWRQVVDHPDVNLVLICTPDALHYEAAMACAARGLHLFCEKPVALNTAHAKEIWEAYRDQPLGHFVPFWTRFIPMFREAREVVRSGRIGTVQAFVFRWHNPRPQSMPFTWRDDAALSSAGSIADVGSHAYDALRWILNDEAERVTAHADIVSPPRPDLGAIDLAEAIAWGKEHDASEAPSTRAATAYDYASLAIEMKSGVVGTIVLSHSPYIRKGLAPDLELHGSEGSLSVTRATGQIRIVSDSGDEVLHATLPDNGLGNRFRQFVFPAIRASIESGGDAEYPGLEDGYRAQRFTDAASSSAKRGERVMV